MPHWKFDYTSHTSTLVKVGGAIDQSPATEVIHFRLISGVCTTYISDHQYSNIRWAYVLCNLKLTTVHLSTKCMVDWKYG